MPFNARHAADLFAQACELATPQEQATFLEQACAGNSELLQRVQALMAAHDQAGSFLKNPAMPGKLDGLLPPETSDLTTAPLVEAIGTFIGPYKLMEKIGEGGFGLVYVAEQHQPVRRKVALKIIKPGMDTREVIARFEAERQALALMDHPHIARVFDAGTTGSGRPYFVMELVRGIPINDYCDQQQLTARQRLELFISVCQAVQHAHSKGIIHRDLKPSNILVAPHDGTPVVKVIDFGIAKAIGQQLTDKSIYTRFMQMIGTPLYMSPEQAEINALDVDIRSDVYSLGVLLYELLTGTTPLDRQRLVNAAYEEIRRIIKEEEPPRPSLRLSTMGEAITRISSQRKMQPAALSAYVKGDLDWIVMKCLEKDRNRRYETAVSLAKDIQRYLAEEPVEACPPSFRYRAWKFVQRHRRSVLAASVMMGLLLLGLAGTITGMIQAYHAANHAAEAGEIALHERDEKEKARLAEENARVAAQHERDAAQAARRDLRRSLYSSQMNLLQTAWETNNTSRVLELLDTTNAVPGEEDLRGFEWHYWNRQSHPELKRIKLDFGAEATQVRGNYVTMTPDGSRCAALALLDPAKPGNVMVRIWDTARGEEVWSFPFNERGLQRLALSGNGQRLAICVTLVDLAAGKVDDTNAKIIVWDIAARKEVATLKMPATSRPASRSPVQLLTPQLSYDGHKLATYALGNTKTETPPGFLYWDLDQGSDAVPVKSPFFGPGSALSPDGTQLATIAMTSNSPEKSLRYQLKIVEAATGKVLKVAPWPATTGPETVVAPNSLDNATLVYSPDGKRIAAFLSKAMQTAVTQYQGAIWDTDGKLLSSFQSPLRPSYFSFSPDGKQLLTWTGARNPIGTIWDCATGEVLLTRKGQVSPVTAVAFNKDGTQVLSADMQGNLITWDGASTDARYAVRDMNRFTTWSYDGSTQCSYRRSAVGEGISVHDALGREMVVFKQHQAAINELLLSFNGKFAVSIDQAGEIRVWNTRTGQVYFALQWKYEGTPLDRNRPAPRFSDDSTLLVMMVPQGGFTVWDVSKDFREVCHCPTAARWMVLSHDGKRLATLNNNDFDKERGFSIWDTETGKKLCYINGRMSHLFFSWDGRWIAGYVPPAGRSTLFALNSPVEVKVWDTGTGKERVHLKNEMASGGIAFSPDGNYLAVAARSADRNRSADSMGDILIWNLAESKVQKRLKGHNSTPSALAFSPDGKRIASATQPVNSSSGDLKVWDTLTGAELISLKARSSLGSSNLLKFSPDGCRLIFISETGLGIWSHQWDATPRK